MTCVYERCVFPVVNYAHTALVSRNESLNR